MMQKLPKIGLPALLLGFILIVFVSKSSINIGYGEAGSKILAQNMKHGDTINPMLRG